MQRDQKSFSKKPAICGALKLTKKLRECLSRQLCRHLLSSRTIERLFSAELWTVFDLRLFMLHSEDRASLHPGLLGSQGTPRIRHGIQPVVIVVPCSAELPLSQLLYSASSDSLHQFIPFNFAPSRLLVSLILPNDVLESLGLKCSSSRISKSTIVSSEDWEDEAGVHNGASVHGPLANG